MPSQTDVIFIGLAKVTVCKPKLVVVLEGVVGLENDIMPEYNAPNIQRLKLPTALRYYKTMYLKGCKFAGS